MLNHLKQETGNDEVKQIVKCFSEQEENNYAEFKGLKNLSNELEELKRQRKKVQLELHALNNPPSNTDAKTCRGLQLKQKQSEEDKKAHYLTAKMGILNKLLLSLKLGIPIIFERIGCNNQEYLKELGDYSTINEINNNNML